MDLLCFALLFLPAWKKPPCHQKAMSTMTKWCLVLRAAAVETEGARAAEGMWGHPAHSGLRVLDALYKEIQAPRW